jgi:hypothetical protein
MSGIGEFEVALKVLEVSINVGKQIKEFIARYRHALESISMIETSVKIANSKTAQFYSALRIIPSCHHNSITEAIEILNPMLEGLAALLARYDHPDGKIHAADKVHWAAFGERRTKKIKAELEEWSHNIFELVVVTLLTIDQTLKDTATPVKKENPVAVSSGIVQSFKNIPGVKAAVQMNEAVTAVQLSSTFTRGPLKVSIADMEIPNPEFTILKDYDAETSYATMESHGEIVVEHIYYNTTNSVAINELEIRESTGNLAHILRNSEPEHCYIPTCKGFFKDDQEPRYSLVFDNVVDIAGVDYTITKYSLKSGIALLKKRERSFNLNSHETAIINALGDIESRTKMATQLIHALSYIHAIGWLHKGLQSSKVLLAVDQHGTVLPLVLGFHRSRPFDTQWSSGLEVHEEWSEILYRHPDRREKVGNATFRRRYDVYALCVVLLELGAGELAVKMVEQPIRNRLANPDQVKREKIRREEANYVVDAFIKAARNLKKKQGKIYSENLERCFRETRFCQDQLKASEEYDEGAEKQADATLCRELLSKWVTDLSTTKY